MNEWFFHVNRPLLRSRITENVWKIRKPVILSSHSVEDQLGFMKLKKKKKGGKLSKFRRNTGLKMIGFTWQSLIRFKGLSISCRSRSCVWVTFSSLLGEHQIFVLKYVVLLWSAHWRFKRRESYRRDIGRVLFSFTFSWTETKSRFNFWVSAFLNAWINMSNR